MTRTLACLAAALCLAPQAFAQSHHSTEQVFRMLETADFNKDGDVTRQEFKNYRSNEFMRLNRNQDNYISAKDIPLIDPSRVAVEISEDLIADFDTDKDGKVSRREFDAGPTLTFNRIDEDGNGIASRYEIAAARAAMKRHEPSEDAIIHAPLKVEPATDPAETQLPTCEDDECFRRRDRSDG